MDKSLHFSETQFPYLTNGRVNPAQHIFFCGCFEDLEQELLVSLCKEATFISLQSLSYHGAMRLDNEMAEWRSRNLLFLSHFLFLYYICFFFSKQEKSISK